VDVSGHVTKSGRNERKRGIYPDYKKLSYSLKETQTSFNLREKTGPRGVLQGREMGRGKDFERERDGLNAYRWEVS